MDGEYRGGRGLRVPSGDFITALLSPGYRYGVLSGFSDVPANYTKWLFHGSVLPPSSPLSLRFLPLPFRHPVLVVSVQDALGMNFDGVPGREKISEFP